MMLFLLKANSYKLTANFASFGKTSYITKTILCLVYFLFRGFPHYLNYLSVL